MDSENLLGPFCENGKNSKFESSLEGPSFISKKWLQQGSWIKEAIKAFNFYNQNVKPRGSFESKKSIIASLVGLKFKTWKLSWI